MNGKEKMGKKLLMAFSLSLSFGVSGCAGYSPRTQRRLDAAPAKKVSELRRHKLEHGKKHKHEISAECEAFESESGKSYAVLFELPEFKESSVIEIKSYCACFGFTKNVFIPVAVLLDGDFNKISEIEFVTHTSTLMEPVHFVSEAALEKGDKYVLVYSDPRRYGKPADRVSVEVVRVRREKMDYIRKGQVMETYSNSQMGIWWRGHAFGKIQILVKDPSK